MSAPQPSFWPNVTVVLNGSPYEQPSAPAVPASLPKVFEVTDMTEREVRAFKMWFADAFARWLRENFSSPEQVNAVFRGAVRFQTVLNWWNGVNKPSGDTLMLVAMIFPQAVPWFVAEWTAHKRKGAA